MPKSTVHDAVFRLVPALYPIVIRILKRCELRGPEFFTLSYVRHHGQRIRDEDVMLTSQLSDVLTALFYETEGGSSGFVTKMAERELVRRTSITAAERLSHFGSDQGSKAVIAITKLGQQRLDQVNTEVSQVLSDLFPSKFQQQVLKVLTFVGQRLEIPTGKLPNSSEGT